MNEIVNKFSLAGNKCMPEMHTLVHTLVHLLKTKNELKNLCRQEIQIIFTKMILIKLVFNMTRLL